VFFGLSLCLFHGNKAQYESHLVLIGREDGSKKAAVGVSKSTFTKSKHRILLRLLLLLLLLLPCFVFMCVCFVSFLVLTL
jgi:hypothetical protein